MEFKGTRALVVGMAKSGVASVELLIRHGALVRAADLRTASDVQQRLDELHVPFQLQAPVPIEYKDVRLDCGYRIDLLVDRRVVVELKAVENLAPIHDAVLLTYLRLSGCSIGLLINFHTVVLKDGIRRLVHQYRDEKI